MCVCGYATTRCRHPPSAFSGSFSRPIATYTRISTDEEHQPYSLEAQAERLNAYAKGQDDWRIARRFSDQASGAVLDRPGLERALREAEAKRFDVLLVYRVDR